MITTDPMIIDCPYTCTDTCIKSPAYISLASSEPYDIIASQ